MRILLTAEPFGFGPAAMARRLYDELQQDSHGYGFLGLHHTSDLFADAVIEHRYHFADYPPHETLVEIIASYDLVITAMDWRIAELCRGCSVPVIFLDALTWYWPTFPDVISDVALYVAQDFLGVRERVANELSAVATVVVPPMLGAPEPADSRHGFLLNLGGLSNPHVSDASVLSFGAACVQATTDPTQEWHRLGNSFLARQCEPGVFETLPPHQALQALAHSSVAVLTGGLGNIFDAASLGTIPAVFVPAANDSQGQQLRLLQEAGYLDAWVDWDTLEFPRVDYRGNQGAILQEIARNMDELAHDPHRQKLLKDAIQGAVIQCRGTNPKLGRLLDHLGRDGIHHTVVAIRAWIARSETST